MGSWQPRAQSKGFGCSRRRGGDGIRGLKCDELRNGSRAGSAAKRAILEMAVASHVVVHVMRRHGCLDSHRTDLQQERSAARRHEADRNVGPKQEQRQQ
jgi:hypothetical protein